MDDAVLSTAPLTEGSGHAGKQYPVTINEMLLRGCTLKNSKSIIGAVVYTGNESRIQKNSAKTPHKIGAPLFQEAGQCQLVQTIARSRVPVWN